jgi:hypothetical protein
MPKRFARARFVILNAPRTGSNFLCSLLNSHPDILCHHEIFNPYVIVVARHLQGTDFRLGTMEEREGDPIDFLRRVWSENEGRLAVGFKLCLWQHEAAYHAVVADWSVRKIILKRRNRIKTFVSLLLARQTGEWVVYDDSGRPGPRPAIHIDIAALRDNIALHERYYRETEEALRQSHQDYVVLWYEDLFTPRALDETFNLLSVRDRRARLRGQTWKLTPVALRDVIANFGALDEELRGTDLAAELHAVGL